MEEKRVTFTGFIARVLVIFSTVVLFMAVVGPFVGEDAMTVSSAFRLGGQGISYTTLWQALLVSLYINVLRLVLETDWFIKKMSLVWRTVWLMFLAFVGCGAMCAGFGWFPVNQPFAWAIYLLGFSAGAVLGTLVVTLKARRENRRYRQKLEEYKQSRQRREE